MEGIKKKRNRKKTDKSELIINLLSEKDCILSETTKVPIYYRDTVYFYCKKHMEIGEQKLRTDSFYSYNFYCKKCRNEHRSKVISGENSPTWKGGLTSLRSRIRYSLNEWKSLTLKAYNYTCFLTDSKENLEVHHLLSFDTILNNVAKEFSIDLNNNISSISKKKLKLLEEKVLEFHINNNIGVVLNKDVHKDFHRIYGLGNNTPEQFYEFCKNFNKIVSENDIKEFNVYSPKNLPKSKNGTSKYIGITRNPNGKWEAHISYHGKQIYIGTFNTEYRAVVAYNNKAIELFGENARTNDIKGLKDHWVYEDSYYPFKKNGTSIYTGIHFSKNGWRYEIVDNGKRILSGSAKTELQAVYLYNKKKRELLGENTIINFLTPEEEEEAKKSLEFKYEYYKHKKDSNTIYTNVFKSGKKWGARINLNGKLIVIGSTYLTDKEAGIAYNNYVISNNLKRKLNKIV